MTNKTDYILLKRDDVAKAIKDWSVASYGMQLLAYICETRNLELSIRSDEVCQFFNISPRQLEMAAQKRRIKSVIVGDKRVYSAFEVVRLVEELNRAKRFRALNGISYRDK